MRKCTGILIAVVVGNLIAPMSRTLAEEPNIPAEPNLEEKLAAMQRLRETYSLDRVAAEQIEVEYDDLLGMTAILTKRVPVQARFYPHAVFVHPDLSISIGVGKDSLAFGVAIGDPIIAWPDMYKVTRRLHKGYCPIVESTWDIGKVKIVQTALAYLPENDEVIKGDEKQDVAMRLAVTNTSGNAIETSLLVPIGLAEKSHVVNYSPFTAPRSRFQQEPMGITHRATERALLIKNEDKEQALLTYTCSSPTTVTFSETDEETKEADVSRITNVLRFALGMKPGETRTIDLMLAGSFNAQPASDCARMAKVTFDDALARVQGYWDCGLEPGMKLTTPDERINDIYRHMILSILCNNIVKYPDRPHATPLHGAFHSGVWPWEFAHTVVPLISVGYHEEVKPALKFFVDRQVGVGKHEDREKRPDGDVLDTTGTYSGDGQPFRWMCETGAILWALATEFRYSNDIDWLNANKASLLAAWKWIQDQRDTNRLRRDDGTKVDHYGLLPKGRPYDWKGWRHHFAFSDNVTWKSMAETAAAFRDAGFPEATQYMEEADEYRKCIADVVDRIKFVDPETNILFVPHTVYFRKGSRGGIWMLDLPELFATGLLDCKTHWYWEPMNAFREKRWGSLMGLTMHFAAGGKQQWDVTPDSPFWYVVCTELGYHRSFLARGEIEKALLVFYSTLAYGMSQDCYQTVERIDVRTGNFAPFQPNASGNGRVIAMIKRTVIDEQDEDKGILWLLRGCPRWWFAEGESITVENAPTVFGTMALRTKSDDNSITVDIDPPTRHTPKELRLVVRHPDRRLPKKVTVNGKALAVKNETVILPKPSGHQKVVYSY